MELRRKQAEKSAGAAPEPERSGEHDDFKKDSEKGIDDDIES